jgi:arginine decarboxylase
VVELDPSTPGCKYFDPTRLTVTVTGLNLTGFAADEILTDRLGVVAELPSLRHLTFIISLGNTLADIDRLVAAFTELATNYHQDRAIELPSILPPSAILTTMHLTPRQADRSHHLYISIDDAIGNISAESICPYPPGIPIVMPGEMITAAALDYLRQVLALGGEIAGCSDLSLATIAVVDR